MEQEHIEATKLALQYQTRIRRKYQDEIERSIREAIQKYESESLMVIKSIEITRQLMIPGPGDPYYVVSIDSVNPF